jgi:hypothetical protein
MEVWRNKAKGTSFIFLRDLDPKIMSLVTPDGEIKALERDKFEGPFEEDESDLVRHSVLTEDQLTKYHRYQRVLANNMLEIVNYVFEGMPHEDMDKALEMRTESEKIDFLRHKYAQVYRRLLEKRIPLNNLNDLLSMSGGRIIK